MTQASERLKDLIWTLKGSCSRIWELFLVMILLPSKSWTGRHIWDFKEVRYALLLGHIFLKKWLFVLWFLCSSGSWRSSLGWESSAFPEPPCYQSPPADCVRVPSPHLPCHQTSLLLHLGWRGWREKNTGCAHELENLKFAHTGL